MAKYRHALPQLRGDFFLTDGGIETTLIFLEGLDLPDFAAFHLFRTAQGENSLRKYFRTYAELAQRHHTGFGARDRHMEGKRRPSRRVAGPDYRLRPLCIAPNYA